MSPTPYQEQHFEYQVDNRLVARALTIQILCGLRTSHVSEVVTGKINMGDVGHETEVLLKVFGETCEN